MRSSCHPGSEDREAFKPRYGLTALCTPTRFLSTQAPHHLTLQAFQDSAPSSIYPRNRYHHHHHPPPPIRLFLLGLRLQLLPSYLPLSTALTSSGPPHLKMLLKTNWQNLGHGAVGGVWSPPVTGAAGQCLPGLSKGEEEKGEGGGWAQQESLRGRRKLAGRRKNSGRGRRLQGPREPQWRNRAQRRLRKRLSPAEGSWRQNSAQVTSPPPPYVLLHGAPRCIEAQEFGARGAGR